MADTPQTPSFDLNAFNAQHPNFESPIAISSLTGPGGADLSLSELSIDDLPPKHRPRFSLFAPPTQQLRSMFQGSRRKAEDTREEVESDAQVDHADPDEDAGNLDGEEEQEPERDDEGEAHGSSLSRSQPSSQSREEKLQSDLFILRKLNTTLTQHIEAIKETNEATEKTSARIEEANRLLDLYVSILWETERTSRLVFDQSWQGGEQDDAVIQERIQAQQEAQERERREMEERLERERERKEKEREQSERLKKEKETEKSFAIASSGVKGVRGVRGLRAGTRPRDAVHARQDAAYPHSNGTGRGNSLSTRGTAGVRRLSPGSIRGRVT